MAKAEPKTAIGTDLSTAMAVVQSAFASYKTYQDGDRSIASAVRVADTFLSELVEKGVTLEDLISIMRTAEPLIAMLFGAKKPKGRGGRPRGSSKRGLPRETESAVSTDSGSSGD